MGHKPPFAISEMRSAIRPHAQRNAFRPRDVLQQSNWRNRSVLLSLSLSVKNLKPLSAFLHPNAPAVIRTRHVLAFGSLLNRRFVRNHGNVSAGEDDFHVGK